MSSETIFNNKLHIKNNKKYNCLYIFIKYHKNKVRLLAIKYMNEKYPYCDNCERGDKDSKCFYHK